MYHGIVVDADIDDCDSSPCQHGTCIDRVNGYDCDCDSGYSGDDCETGNYKTPF